MKQPKPKPAELAPRSRFSHLSKSQANVDWANTLAKARTIHQSILETTTLTAQATASDIIRAGKLARHEIEELPADPTARAIVNAGKKRRGEI